MIASLYQSGSLASVCAMRLTFAAPDVSRNYRFKLPRPVDIGSRIRKKRPRRFFGTALEKLSERLALNFADLRGNALPFTAAHHPGVGKQECPIERFSVFGASNFPGPSGH